MNTATASGAVAGLVYLVSPGIAAPPALGALLMGTAGVAWGIYSILGRAVSDPVWATAPVMGGFKEARPSENAEPKQRTEFRVA